MPVLTYELSLGKLGNGNGHKLNHLGDPAHREKTYIFHKYLTIIYLFILS